MSESHVPTRTPTGVSTPAERPPTPGPAATSSDDTGIKGRAKEGASQAAESLGDIAHDARDKASEVAGAATKQVKGLAEQARDEVATQTQTQQKRAADGLRSLSTELSSMATRSEDPGYATDLVQQASAATDRVATWLDERDPRSIVQEVQEFARRRPGLFIALAAGAGVLVGRLARGMKDAQDSDRPPGASDAEGGRGTAAAGSTATGPRHEETGSRSPDLTSEQSLLDRESAGFSAGVTPAPVARHGENDVERL